MKPARAPALPTRRLLASAALGAWLVGLACLAQATDTASAPPSPASTKAAQVLVLTGTDPFLPAYLEIDRAMREAVARRHGRQVLWIHESIDTARFGGDRDALLAELLARKYERVRIDAVVLVTEPAVEFHLHHRERLWPRAPAVFHSVAPKFAHELTPDAALVGVPAVVDFAGTARIALALQPRARRLLVLGGVSPFDELQLAQAREALAPLADRLGVEYLTGLPPRELAERLARETPETIAIFSSLFRDAQGQLHQPREALATLAATSGTPVYGVFETYLGHGLAGGSIESFDERGRRTADLLVQALDGRPAARRIIDPPASVCIADGRQLVRFGLREAALPAGCDVRFVEPSFLERYWWQSIAVALAIAGQSLLIAALLLQRRRRRAAEASLVAQRMQLLHAARLAVAGELTASIAHEINQPLGAILSNADAAEMLLESGRMERAELLQILGDIRRDDLRASAVIQRLRALLARHETERRPFDLHRLVEDTVALLRAEAARRGVVVELALDARRSGLVGDAVQIQQLLINLMLNAFDALAARPEGARRMRVSSTDGPGGVQLAVRDFGTGIATADLPKIFDPFFSTKHSGMGLGLAIARSIVEAHGGTISARGHDDGAEFGLTLPFAAHEGRSVGEGGLRGAADATDATGPTAKTQPA